MVQRYSNNGFCVADADGRYVKYEDYAKLERKFKELMAWRVQVLNDAFSFLTRAEKAEAELQKYKDQFRITSSARTVGQLHMRKGWSDGTEI